MLLAVSCPSHFEQKNISALGGAETAADQRPKCMDALREMCASTSHLLRHLSSSVRNFA